MSLLHALDQPYATARLQHAFAADKLPHGLLLTRGEAGTRRALVVALAAAINCEALPGQGCGACTSCHKFVHGLHPDWLEPTPQGASQQIPIEQIRQLIGALAMRPHEAARRVIFIEDANALAAPAANALLKILEEPPPNNLFVLGASAPEQLLPTLRSRTQRLKLRPTQAVEPTPSDLARGLIDACVSNAGAPPTSPTERADVASACQSAAIAVWQHARNSATSGELETATRYALQAKQLLAAYQAIRHHNANPMLTLEVTMQAMKAVP